MRNDKGQFVKGHGFTDEMLAKMSEAKIGKQTWNTGKKNSPEHVRKMVESHKGMRIWNKGIPMSEEQKIKISKSRKGIKAWNKGIGNKTSEGKKIKSSIEYKLWRDAVFARDNWTCQKTGIKGGRLHPHHILNFSQHPELRLAIDNGITLSEKAHREFHSKYGKTNNTIEQLHEFIKSNTNSEPN